MSLTAEQQAELQTAKTVAGAVVAASGNGNLQLAWVAIQALQGAIVTIKASAGLVGVSDEQIEALLTADAAAVSDDLAAQAAAGTPA